MAYFKVDSPGQATTLCNNRHNCNFAQLLHHNHVNWPQRVDEVQAAMDTRILDVMIMHGCKFFAKICAVFFFDTFDNGILAISAYTQLRIFLIN